MFPFTVYMMGLVIHFQRVVYNSGLLLPPPKQRVYLIGTKNIGTFSCLLFSLICHHKGGLFNFLIVAVNATLPSLGVLDKGSGYCVRTGEPEFVSVVGFWNYNFVCTSLSFHLNLVAEGQMKCYRAAILIISQAHFCMMGMWLAGVSLYRKDHIREWKAMMFLSML